MTDPERDQKALGLREALAALSSGALTSTELVQGALQASEQCRQRYNAFSVLAPEQALEAAGASDAKWSGGKARPLEGLPIAVKDMFDTAGIETRYGSKAYLGHVPDTDAELVARLKDLGAIVVGKTTTHEFAWGVTTESTFFGDTLNPHAPDRTPGGSSGGMAAAVAAGAVAAGLGTDTGGSVRIPAALCGVVGYKPTRGLWPSAGIFPLSTSLDHPGVIGRSVDDVALLAEALGVAIPSDDDSSPRVAFISALTNVPVAEDVGQRFGAAVALLQPHVRTSHMAATVLENVFADFAAIVLAEAGFHHFGLNDSARIADYEPETRQRLTLAREVTLGRYAECQERRRHFMEALDQCMSDLDFLILPTTACTAPLRGQASATIGEWTGNVREALMAYTAPFNLSGLPAISLPLPGDPGALPAGLQIVGRRGADSALLKFAYVVEAALRSACDDNPGPRILEEQKR